VGEPSGEAPRGGDTSARAPENAISIESIQFESDHGLLRGCGEDIGWRWPGRRCPEPQWSPSSVVPISHTMGEKIRLRLALDAKAAAGPILLRGEGPDGISFTESISLLPGATSIPLTSEGALGRRMRKLSLDLRWSVEGASSIVPASTAVPVFVTMGPPRDRPRAPYEEDAVTLRRLEKAMEWVEPASTIDPHSIVAGLMRRFPYYALLPSPRVPPEYDHPRYFNNLGGAWPMVEHAEESGECQAIVRLVRGMLAQLGVPGEARMLVVWADPEYGGGAHPIVADWEKDPSAGLSRRRKVRGKELVAALVDSPVEEGKVYPPSHTRAADGRASPGLNRYEACLEFSHGGLTRYYCGGAGVLSSRRDILRVFWGLVWVELLGDDEGFRVEKIVRRYRGSRANLGSRLRSFLERWGEA